MFKITGTLLLVMALCTAAICQSDWAYVRGDDAEPIGASDTLIVTLGTVRAKTRNTFLTQVDQVGVVIQAKVSGTKKVTTDGVHFTTAQDSASFPMAYLVPNPDRGRPRVTLPFEQTFIPELHLIDGDSEYKNLTIEVDLAKVDGQTTEAKVIQKLLSFASAASLPASPFASGVKYVADFANGFVSEAISGAGNDEKVPLGTRSINFRVNPPPKTGLYLLIDSPEAPVGNGWVNPADLSGNCLYAQRGANTTIMVGRKVAGATDTDGDGCSAGTYTPLQNAFVPILIQTEVAVPSRIAAHIAILAQDPVINPKIQGRIRQCADIGLSAENCKAAHPQSEVHLN